MADDELMGGYDVSDTPCGGKSVKEASLMIEDDEERGMLAFVS